MRSAAVIVLFAVLYATSASALTGAGLGSGFVSGFVHPMLRLDHVAAMVAVGLWGAILRAPAVWVLPVAFPIAMAAGGALGVEGVDPPWVDAGIAVSAAIVAVFAVFHGHAHGSEMPPSIHPVAFGLGFVCGTGLLHMAGVALGQLTVTAPGRLAVRAFGGIIALAGLGFLTGTF